MKYFSYVALERIVEDDATLDGRAQRELEKSGRPLRSLARELSDEEVLEKLRESGVELDRGALQKITKRFVSAEAASRELIDGPPEDSDDWSSDWIWIGICLLWERWFPETPNYEKLDDAMQEGYNLEREDNQACAQKWNAAWMMIENLADRSKASCLREFDEDFVGTQIVSNWIHDYSTTLVYNSPDYQKLIEVGKSFEKRFPEDQKLIQCDLADAYFRHGQVEKAEGMFQEITKNSDRVWDWLRWARAYSWADEKTEAYLERGEEILKTALKRPYLEEAENIFDELDEIYKALGKDLAELEPLRAEAKKKAKDSSKVSNKIIESFGEQGMDMSGLANIHAQMKQEASDLPQRVPAKIKIGRNDPCPCGSGKKYKKCCG